MNYIVVPLENWLKASRESDTLAGVDTCFTSFRGEAWGLV
jgi:hypothetical protein